MRTNLRLEKQEEILGKKQGILVNDISEMKGPIERKPIALIGGNEKIQFYDFNKLSVDDIEAIVEISKNFFSIFNSL